MKNILVPCDYSLISKEAFKMAVDIASRTEGSVTVLYVIFLPTIYTPDYVGDLLTYNGEYVADMEKEARRSFEELRGQRLNVHAEFGFEVVAGDITVSIQNVIEKRGIDLVVMGTTGASGLKEVFIGSNTEKVVRHVKVPVLVVREPVDLNAIRNILVPTSCGLNETEFISHLKLWQSFLKAKLDVLLVNTPGHFRSNLEGMEELRSFVKHYHLQDYELHFQNHFAEEEGILDFVSKHKPICVAMSTHGRKGLAHLFSHSIAEHVVNHIDVPIWTFQLARR